MGACGVHTSRRRLADRSRNSMRNPGRSSRQRLRWTGVNGSVATSTSQGWPVGDITLLIAQASAGDKSAADALFSAVYQDMRRIAARQAAAADFADAPGRTSLVHESYLRLARPDALKLADRHHFFAVAARAMRQISIDHARQRLASKRGGGINPDQLDTQRQAGTAWGLDGLLDLDQALTDLEAVEPRLARLVELRVFSGLELEEAGQITGLSASTLKRDWRKARAFLHARLRPETLLDALED